MLYALQLILAVDGEVFTVTNTYASLATGCKLIDETVDSFKRVKTNDRSMTWYSASPGCGMDGAVAVVWWSSEIDLFWF